MSSIIDIQLARFVMVYILILVVLLVMKYLNIDKTKSIIISTLRMSIQLTISGLILKYIFNSDNIIYTSLYLMVMIIFSIYLALSKNKDINIRFKIIIALSLTISSMIIVSFLLVVVLNTKLFNPQYIIPISGMVLGNALTAVTLAVKSFRNSIKENKSRIEALINVAAEPVDILMPFVRDSLETALIPTINYMLGMGIVSLPGMMTGQIISGTIPTTAIVYQIAIMVAICAVVCLSSFFSLYFGQKTMYNDRGNIIY